MKRFYLILFYCSLALAVYAQNPVAYYPFNGNANDAMGTTPGINGTVNGAVLTTGITGAANTAYSFNDNNWIEFADNAVFDFGNSDYSISIWLKYINNQPDGYSMIFCKDGYNTAGYQALANVNSSGNIWYRTPNSLNLINITLNNLINNGAWHHHVFMRKGNDLFYYVDAVLRSQKTGGAGGFLSNNYRLILGGNQDVTTEQSFRGAMDEFRLYNRALTDQEITNLYNTDVCNNPAPTITVSGPTTFCQGGSVTLTSSATTGNHLWSNGETTQSITVSNGGTYSVTNTNAGCTSSPSSSIQVTVVSPLVLPSISSSTGTTTICEPYSTMLTSSALTGNLWSNGATTRSISVNSSGTFTVSVTNACGTYTSLPITILVNPRPPAPTITTNGPTTFCSGGSVVLSSNYATGNLWDNGTAQSPGTTPSITVNTSGLFSVFYQDANGCYSVASAPTQVTVNPRPNPPVITASGPLSICAGASLVLTSSVPAGILWSNGATTGSITVYNSGSYTVNTTNASGCTSNNAVPKVVTVNPFVTYYQDNDGDGYGNASVSIQACTPQSGYVPVEGDCNDNDPQVNPGEQETLNNIDDDCDGLTDEGISCNPYDIVFSKSFGGSAIDEAKDIKQTADGGYIIVGSTSSNNGNVLGNHGNFDCWVVKLNAGGNLQWQKTFGGTGRDIANSVIIANDGNFVVAGSTNSINGDVTLNNGSYDFWIFKIDPNGNLLWQKSYGGTGSDEASSIIQTSDNGYAVCGSTTSSALSVVGNPLGNGDYGILKLDASGNLEWQKIMGGSSLDEPTSIAQLNDGHIVVAGYTFSNDNDISGYMGNGDGWIVKLDLAGNSIWNKTFGNTFSQQIFSIVSTTDGGFVFAGTSSEPNGPSNNPFYNGINGWVLKSTAAGVIEWQKLIGSSATERLYSIKQKNDGSYVAAGESNQFSYLLTGYNYMVVSLTQSGTVGLNRTFGGSNEDNASCIIPTVEDGVIVAGKSNSTNNQVSGNLGQNNFWVLKLSGPSTINYYQDNDGDGFGNPSVSILGCSRPPGYVADNTDCDDTRSYVYPGAIERCGNNIDDNCNGITDEPSNIPALTEIIGPQNVCGYIDANNVYPAEYSVPSVPNATNYVWRVAPTMTILSGQGTPTISVYIGTGFAANPDKMISVYAVSPCDTSNIVYIYPKAQSPGTPGIITATSTDICSVIGSNIPITYKIQKVAGATSYIWNLPSGASGISHPAGAGVNDTIVEITYSNLFTTGNLTVKANNDCGLSSPRSLLIIRNTVATPGPISGPTNACPHTGNSGTLASYTTTAQGSNTFTWTIPPNATNISGQGTNSISFRYPTGFTTGTLSVTVTNGCGTSAARSLNIQTLYPATPGIIDVIQFQVCPFRIYDYTLATIPSNATSLLWDVPAGGTILSGQGTRSIRVSYPQTVIDGFVTVRSISNCRNSSTRTNRVKLAACLPFFTRNMEDIPESKIKNEAVPFETLTVQIFPNPSTTDFKLQVISAGSEEISVRVLDMTGRFIRQVTIMPYQTINIGADLKAGSYLFEVRQGKQVKTTRVLKF